MSETSANSLPQSCNSISLPLTVSDDDQTIDFLEVVATKGAYLITRPNSPLPRAGCVDSAFVGKLQERLEALLPTCTLETARPDLGEAVLGTISPGEAPSVTAPDGAGNKTQPQGEKRQRDAGVAEAVGGSTKTRKIRTTPRPQRPDALNLRWHSTTRQQRTFDRNELGSQPEIFQTNEYLEGFSESHLVDWRTVRRTGRWFQYLSQLLRTKTGSAVLGRHETPVIENGSNFMIPLGSVPDSKLTEALWVLGVDEDDRCHCQDKSRTVDKKHTR
ncbi:hypothetical protein B0H63DRAFT_563462 [Podospora didyma]|uniref:Uncharacterized protein n=1 Tax=Podospora didyma TaxID=330526 RepID=A0AAE0N5Z2_9PEZI|nr:hypothetical protein B0H63DRAFT_563462 [Podospora didyma]